MLIIYYLLGLGLTTAHSDYGVSFRAQNFEETLQNIDKEALRNHQRERRFVTGYFVPQNATNRHTWESNSSREYVANVTRLQHKNNATRPYDTIIYPEQPGFVAPSKNTSGDIIFARTKGTNNVTPQYYVNPEQNSNVTRPGYTNYNNIDVKPGYNKHFSYTSDSSGLIVKPVNPVTSRYIPYPGFNVRNPGYLTPNTVLLAPKNGDLVPNTDYIELTTGRPIPNTGYTEPTRGDFVSNTGSIEPTTGCPVPNTGSTDLARCDPVPNTDYTEPTRGDPVPSTGSTELVNGDPIPNNGYMPPNNGFPIPSSSYPPPYSGIPLPYSGNSLPNSGFLVSYSGLPPYSSPLHNTTTIIVNTCALGMKPGPYGTCKW